MGRAAVALTGLKAKDVIAVRAAAKLIDGCLMATRSITAAHMML